MTPVFLSTGSNIAQLIAVFLIFIFVIAVTGLTTRWIGGYMKEKSVSENVTVVESKRIGPNKFVEIVRIGERYFAIALGKNEVTFLSEVSGDSLHFPEETGEKISFKEFLNRAKEEKKEN